MCFVESYLTLKRLPPHQCGYDPGVDVSKLSFYGVQLPVHECPVHWCGNLNHVSVHFDSFISTDAKLFTFAILKWENETSSFVSELLWLSPVRILVTLSDDKLLLWTLRSWSELLDFSSSHRVSQSGIPIPVLYNHSPFTPLPQSALITSTAPPFPNGLLPSQSFSSPYSDGIPSASKSQAILSSLL